MKLSLSKLNNWQQQSKKLTWGSITAGSKHCRGHTGHRLGPGHSWLMQLGLSGKWLSKQGPEWLPLTGTSALSPLIHSKEPQSNTQRHTVTRNNTAQSGGTQNESHWPKLGDRHQFAHQIWAQQTVWLNRRTGWWSQSHFLRYNIAFCRDGDLLQYYWALHNFSASWSCSKCIHLLAHKKVLSENW